MKKKKLTKLNFGHDDQAGFSRAKFSMDKMPWPIETGSLEEISALMCFQYVAAMERPKVMDEAYRCLQKGGKMTLAVPYRTSPRSTQDYKTQWPQLSEDSFYYFDRDWIKVNHPDRKCDGAWELSFSYQADADVANKNDETRSYMIKHYNNTVNDLIVVMTKKD